jgi:hypothetical protein
MSHWRTSTVAGGRLASFIDAYAALLEDEVDINTVDETRYDVVVEANVEMSTRT